MAGGCGRALAEPTDGPRASAPGSAPAAVPDAVSADLLSLAEGLLALGLGGAVGWQRQRDGKDAGLRTMMLVAFASFLFVRVSLVAGEAPGVQSDPVRAIQSVATALGFVGAGIVYRDRHADRTRGLTTAAAMLAVAPVGIAVALGRPVLAIGATLILVVVLGPVDRFEKRTSGRAARHEPHPRDGRRAPGRSATSRRCARAPRAASAPTRSRRACG